MKLRELVDVLEKDVKCNIFDKTGMNLNEVIQLNNVYNFIQSDVVSFYPTSHDEIEIIIDFKRGE